MENRRNYEQLSVMKQQEYELKARYLIERGYMESNDIVEVAKRLYEKDK